MWEPDEELLEDLKLVYLEIEGSLEDEMGVVSGNMQGGSTDVFSVDEVHEWKAGISHRKPVHNFQKTDKEGEVTGKTPMEKRSESG